MVCSTAVAIVCCSWLWPWLCRGRVRGQVDAFNEETSLPTPEERLKPLTRLKSSNHLYTKCEDWSNSVSEFEGLLALGLATTISLAEVEKPIPERGVIDPAVSMVVPTKRP